MSCRFCANNSSIDKLEEIINSERYCMIKQKRVRLDFYCGEFTMRMSPECRTMAESAYLNTRFYRGKWHTSEELRKKKNKMLKKRNKEIKELKDRIIKEK